MSESRKASQNSKKSPLTRRFHRGMAATVAGTGILVGGLVTHAVDGQIKHNNDPACAVPAHEGDQLAKIEDKLGSSDNVQVWVTSGREAPFMRNPKNTRNYYVDGTQGLQAGDEVLVNHVDPMVCMNVGGVVLTDISPEAIVVAAEAQTPKKPNNA